MRLEVITPMAVCVDRPVRRIVAEGPDGCFGLLPGHIDFVSALVPGILLYETEDSAERFVAVNSGTLVKCGAEVRVAVRGAVEGDDLGALRARVEAEFRKHDEEERDARAALARLEAGMVRRFRDLGASLP
ncbi:F0F1 ATP synthase subunit epsilon [Lutimaribacter saemankumensis]|uniref:ATP synthase epsilon chain n=1 Tax=Lutimaribacter saemankumensis TaxID=490829 RepID=A0A1G8TBH4_9RHOB|nr:F0F1 ATP synthase subunit epsilon [Lutimaribacter saemankumensis]SDJ38275.1 F-type H+-transporting ATPase subunit epsilon [Lutimaribacter saemankumensis]